MSGVFDHAAKVQEAGPAALASASEDDETGIRVLGLSQEDVTWIALLQDRSYRNTLVDC
ncbi:MAG: hypothetical protein OEV40_26300 [Acidimicrobiia bacterium]|nr:hypothetical protein [Acidimicrobiia bacterium]